MELSYNKLADYEIDEQLQTVQDWIIQDGALVKNFTFNSYANCVLFATAIAHLADTLNHHPDLHIGYQKVRVSMTTHDADGGLTHYDFELARRIDRISPPQPQ